MAAQRREVNGSRPYCSGVGGPSVNINQWWFIGTLLNLFLCVFVIVYIKTWAREQDNWSEYSLSSSRNYGSLATHRVHCEDSDQTVRLGGGPGWSESSLGGHIILLVLSWDGSSSLWFSIIWARSCENVSYAICEQQRRRSACASAQSDQRLCCSLLG